MAKKQEVAAFPLEKTRNIGIIAHIDAGKTTTTERILYYTGRQHRLGNVDEGNTTTDWLPQERERGITIIAAAVTTHWTPEGGAKHRINIIDTPGHVDFTAEVERSLRVLDGAVVVISGVEGVQAQTETVWRQANRHLVPRFIFVNKLDRIGADFNSVVGEIDELLDGKPLVLQIPIGQEKELRGVIDLIRMKALTWDDMEGDEPAPPPAVSDVPAELRDDAEIARITMVERLCDFDEALAAKYLEGQELSEADIRAAVRRLTLEMKLTPVLCGAAQRCKGVQPVLDAVCHYLPAPTDLPPVKGKVPRSKRQLAKGGGGKKDADEEVLDAEDWADGERRPEPNAPFCALAFKTHSDKNSELTYLRVYSGRIDGSQQVLNPRRNKRERLSQLYIMHANKREQIEQASAGEIVAAVGLRYTRTGDTLCDPDSPILLGAIQFPEPVISMAVEPVSTADKDTLADAIERYAKDDPTFSSRVDKETGQTLISGMGELHLEIVKSRILSEWNVKAKVGKPRVAFRQTITGKAEGENKFVRAGAKPMFGHVILKVEPWKGSGEERVQVLIVAPEDQIPRAFHPAIVDAIKTAAQGSLGWGYPLIDVRVWVTGGSTHPTDANEGAFSAAAAQAFREAGEKAGVVLLEPIMSLEVESPAEFVGNVIRDLNQRHAEILGDEEIKSGIHQINARVPLAAMVGYSTDVRSMSQGRASFTMEPAAYAEVAEDRRKALGLF